MTLTSHVGAVPEQPPPLQPVNLELPFGIAVSVTVAPLENASVQSVPQLMPAGLLTMLPGPDFVTVSVDAPATTTLVNVAVTVTGVLPVNVQGSVPVHPPPLQPLKTDPAAGAALSVIIVPAGYVAEHAAPQLIPVGLLLTVPAPVPTSLTVTV